jgi:hypothetical protein
MEIRWPLVVLVGVLVAGSIGLIAVGYEEISPLMIVAANLMRPMVGKGMP